MASKDIYAPPNASLSTPEDIDANNSIDDLASRWARFGASLIDTIVLILPPAVLMYGTDYWDRAIEQEITAQEQAISFLIGIGFYLIVNGYLLARRGQTIGKFTLGIRIVSHENNQLLALWKIIGLRYMPRSLLAVVPVVGQFLTLIDLLFIFRKDKRCIHDFIAGTKVIKETAFYQQ